jgi:hypothetical protein
MVTDAANTFHFRIREWSGVQGREPLQHLLLGSGATKADVHGGVGKDEPIAIRGAEGLFTGRHFAGP